MPIALFAIGIFLVAAVLHFALISNVARNKVAKKARTLHTATRRRLSFSFAFPKY